MKKLFVFCQMRRFIIEKLEIEKNGDERTVQFATDSSGGQQNTFSIDHMKVDLEDLELLLSILDDNEQVSAAVPSLTVEKVALLDDLTKRLGMDKYKY